MWLRDMFQRFRSRGDVDTLEAGLTPELREARAALERAKARRRQIANVRADATRADRRVQGR